MLRGNSENDPRNHFYGHKCRVDSKDEGELKGPMMRSSVPKVCGGCSQEFHIAEALELPSR